MKETKMLHTATSIIYIPRHKLTGEYVDEDGNPTNNVFDAVGYADYTNAQNYLNDFDEPDLWYLVAKLTTVTIVGEPIEVIKYI